MPSAGTNCKIGVGESSLVTQKLGGTVAGRIHLLNLGSLSFFASWSSLSWLRL
jgi:hypothetical protein